ncbi:apolipoprotein N-acyltransferase [Streptomyces fuscigenes]|uniref:apolipoprotein N-acyltransferase n=1 Tax=Streptomyces fuscigenes TaxID=1528880 RepID=UPI001F2827C2|nr:apolipoprotein N-acyltransferase [Streptomyces fuscigenes]MCF3964525.1 apolipoprotein N-acyltransferase [Streptomyces fuscigenes]
MSATVTSVQTPQPEPSAAPGRTKPRLPARLARPAAAVAGGLLLYASFPPRPLWFLALPGLALYGWSLHGRRLRAGFVLGLLGGLAFMLPLLVWTSVEVGSFPWIALAVAEAVFMGLAGLGIAAVSRLPVWPLWAAGMWIAGEAVRSRFPFGGFSWGKVAFGQPDGVFLPLAAVGGTPLLGFAVVLCGFGLAEAARQAVAYRRHRTVPRGAVTAAAVTVLAPLAASFAALPLVSNAPEKGSATVAAIQGNVPRMGLDFNSQRAAVLDNHARQTLKLAAEVKAGKRPKPDFVLWPENSSDIDPLHDEGARLTIDAAVKAVGVPTEIGTLVQNPGPDSKLYNTLIDWSPTSGPGATYEKRHIQPFGEYMPMRSIAEKFSKDAALVSQDFSPGTKVGVFTMAGTRVGFATCYEAAFDNDVRDPVVAGAEMLAVPSNNATFDRSQMTYQQLAMDRVRAVEHSRSVVVPTTSGVSAIIRPDGTIVQHSGMFTPAILEARVPLRTSLTPATRLGSLPEWLLVAVGGAGAALALTRAVRARREDGSAAAPGTRPVPARPGAR